MSILHIDSSILGDNSVSRKLSSDIVAKLIAADVDNTVIYRDLAAVPVPHLSGAYLTAVQSAEGDHEATVKNDISLSSEVLQEFIEADTVVIGVGFYNFSIASQLKAWIDRIAVAGRTFRYVDGAPEGLMGGKRLILAIARGGFYGKDSPRAGYEHAETYLRSIFGFLGITDIEVVAAEGLAVGPDHRAAAIAAAGVQIEALAA